jgi:hypothetical protein
MNYHWNVLYQVSVFYADQKSKMATIAGHECLLDGPLQTLGFFYRYTIKNGGYGRT